MQSVEAALPDHAERMDRMYRYQRHIYDLTRKYYLIGRDRMIAGLDVTQSGTLLEIGCGTGRNLVLARRHHPTARLFGLDISTEMLNSARAKFTDAATAPVLVVADATDFDASAFGEQGFDRIMISYALSMIPDWQAALRTAFGALAPGGSLHIVDFGQQENLAPWFRRLLHAWLHRFHVTPRPDLRIEAERLAAEAGSIVTFEPILRGYAWHLVIRR